ncbi:MAG: amidohydrolase family protein, partial [Gammaproteobacteria bacterium]
FGAICRAYNDWIAEFCSEDPTQLKGMAMLNNYDPEDAVRELERARRLGLVGGIISCYPGAEQHYGLPQYDRLWAAAAAHGFPISLHVLTNHNGPYGVPFDRTNYSLRVNADYWFRMSIADMIFNGVFERHPQLVVESSEHEGGWVPYFLWQMDWTWERRIKKRMQSSAMKRAPSEYFRDNVYVSVIYDGLAVEAREAIGVDRLMWGSDFPHEQSTNPNSRTFLAELLAGVDPESARAILRGNAARLFGFETSRAAPEPARQPDAALTC